MVEHIVDRIHHARFRAAEAEWNAIRSGDDARYITEADYRAVIEAWMDTGEVRRARVVFNSCPFVTEETRLLEWEILDAEESLFLRESEIVPPMKIVNDAFFIVVQTGSTTRMYPVVCDEAPWNTGRRKEARRAIMEDLRKWAEGK